MTDQDKCGSRITTWNEKQYAGTYIRYDLWWICYKTLEASSLKKRRLPTWSS
jgi:hypothetical protein